MKGLFQVSIAEKAIIDIAELRNTSQFTILRMKNFVRLQHKQSRTFYRLLHNNISNNFYALESGMDLESACHGQKKDVTSHYNLVELIIYQIELDYTLVGCST